jgi:RNA recognition motif. (a.k.a. RRM, RBD, or RNP domain)
VSQLTSLLQQHSIGLPQRGSLHQLQQAPQPAPQPGQQEGGLQVAHDRQQGSSEAPSHRTLGHESLQSGHDTPLDASTYSQSLQAQQIAQQVQQQQQQQQQQYQPQPQPAMQPAPMQPEPHPMLRPQQNAPPLQQHLQYLQTQLPYAMQSAPCLRGHGRHPGGPDGGPYAHFAARPSAHLRDGVPATAQEVVLAIMEYMARPSSAKPPAGCAPDAIKLFVGNIPKHCTEAVLHKVFQCYGLVVEVAVVRRCTALIIA